MFISFKKNGEYTDEQIRSSWGKSARGRRDTTKKSSDKEGTKSDDSLPWRGESLKRKILVEGGTGKMILHCSSERYFNKEEKIGE